MTTTVMTDIESPAKKRIALVAHDNMKDEMLEWAKAHREELAQHTLVGTGTTGRIVAEHTGLEVERLKSGPLGGDQQSGAVYKEFIYGLATRKLLLWTPKAIPGSNSLNVKFDVANAPLLLGFLIESCDARDWLQQEDHMSAFRQIKAFDPVWFEIGLQTGRLLAMKAIEKKTTARRVRSVDKPST